MLATTASENLSPHKTTSPTTQSFTDIINMHTKVPNCSLMTEGYNNSEKIFFYCTCDPEYQNPICEACLYTCHKQHWKEKQLAEILKEACEGICSCGNNNHIVTLHEIEKNNSFKEKCMFIEWEENSKNYRYYKSKGNNNKKYICPFCYDCCSVNKRQYEQEKYDPKNEKIICECNEHNEYVKNLEKFNIVFNNEEMQNDIVALVKLIQCIFISKNSFKNTFYNMEEVFKKIKQKFSEDNFEIEHYAYNSHLMKALEKIDFILSRPKNYFYFSPDDITINFDMSDIIFKILKYPNQSNNKKIDLFKKYLMTIYHTMIFKHEFESLPSMSYKDLYNLNPFQRLFFCEYMNHTKNKFIKNNTMNDLLDFLEFFKNEKNKSEVNFEILKLIYSELLCYIKAHQITHEQKIKFMTLNDDLIYICIQNKEIDIKTKNTQFYILYKMVKCLLYISYYYNDHLILSYLNNEIPLQKVNFFHCSSELSKIINKNVTQILFYCGLIETNNNEGGDTQNREYKTTLRTKMTTRIALFVDKNKVEYFNDQIMILASSINSLNLDFPDSYQEGLKRLTLFNKDVYINFINEQFDINEKEMFSGLIRLVENIEAHYQDYFNFNLKDNELALGIINIINEVFKLLKIGNYTIPEYKNKNRKRLNLKLALKIGESRKQIQEKKLSLIKKQIILSKSTYIFSLVKSLDILSKFLEQRNKGNKVKLDMFDSEIETDIIIKNKLKGQMESQNSHVEICNMFIERIFKQLYFFCDKNLENCILILTKPIIMNFKKLPLTYSEKILQFLYYILKIIRFNNAELGNISELLTVLKSIVTRLTTSPQYKYYEINSILFNLILKLSKINYQNNELTFMKLSKFIKHIYANNSIIRDIKIYLLNLYQQNQKLTEVMKKDEKINGYPVSSLVQIFKSFLKIINNIFNKNSAYTESTFLGDILSKLDVQKILVDLSLPLDLRIELIRFFLIVYINMKIEPNFMQDYINIIIENVNTISEINSADFNFFNNLISVNEKNINMLNESYLLKYELKNFHEVIKDTTYRKRINKYYENGIIIPLFVFLNKYMAIIYNLDGKQYIKLYEIVFYFLKFKKFIVEEHLNKIKKSHKQYQFSNLILNFMNTKKNSFVLLLEDINEQSLKELNSDIEKIQSEDFEILNYRTVFSFFVKHVQTFIKKPESKFLKELFSKKNEILNIEELETKIKTEKIGIYQGKILRLITHYENEKVNLEDSSLSKNLNEKNILYNASYRSILLRPMFHMINDRILFTKYRKQSLWHLFRLLQYDTSRTQEDILEIMKNEENEENKLVNLHYLCELYFECFLSIVFSSVNPNSISSNEDYIIAYMVIKILKYLCEDHNMAFQTLFFKDIKIMYEENPLNIFEMMMCSLNKVVMLAQWDLVKFNQIEDNYTYFYEIFFVMLEFSVEMIQGTRKSNLKEIISVPGRENENSMFYMFILSFKNIITNDDNDSEIVYNVRLDLLNFIVAFLEEKKTPKKLINMIANVFNPLTIFNSVVKTLIKLYIRTTGDGKVEDYKLIEFDGKMYKLFLQKYFEEPEFSQCNEFELANRMYIYVKLLMNFGNKDAKLLIDSIKTYKDNIAEISNKNNDIKGKEDQNVIIAQNFAQNYFAVKFFEEITRTVWIKGEEGKIQLSLFTLNPYVMLLSQNTKNQFYMTVPRDNASSKLFSLLEYCNYFFFEINHNKKKVKGNYFLKILNKLDYGKIETYLFLLTGVINIIILIKANNDDEENHYEKIYEIVLPLGIIQIILNFLSLLFWIISKFTLYYSIEVEKYYNKNKLDKKEVALSFFKKFYIGLFNTILDKKEIVGFIWNIIFSTAACSSKENIYLFSIQLLIVIHISNTLQNITGAIYLSYHQLLVSILFLIVNIYIFSVIAYRFLKNDYIKEIEDGEENTCETLMYCFLTHMNFGLRTDGGIGEFMKKVSFINEPSHFIGVLFFQFLFFIIIILIVLAIIGGTIIDVFAELLEKEQRDKNDMNNICFICNGKRNSIEKKGENFQEHITKVHNLWTYVDYLIGLKFIDPQETNAINSFVIEKVEEKKISWFPWFSNDEIADFDENDEKNGGEISLDSD